MKEIGFGGEFPGDDDKGPAPPILGPLPGPPPGVGAVVGGVPAPRIRRRGRGRRVGLGEARQAVVLQPVHQVLWGGGQEDVGMCQGRR